MFSQYTTVIEKHTIHTILGVEVSNQLVSWFITYLRDLQPASKGVKIHLLSTMDIPVEHVYSYVVQRVASICFSLWLINLPPPNVPPSGLQGFNKALSRETHGFS